MIQPSTSLANHKLNCRAQIGAIALPPVHGEFVNNAAIGIWNRPRQWCRHAEQ
jgi:hypothetical protein